MLDQQDNINSSGTCINEQKKGTNKLLSTARAIIPQPRRLSSGSACETCRRRKTKCDGGQPCAFCASNGIQCSHRISVKKRKTPSAQITVIDLDIELPLSHRYRQYKKYRQNQDDCHGKRSALTQPQSLVQSNERSYKKDDPSSLLAKRSTGRVNNNNYDDGSCESKSYKTTISKSLVSLQSICNNCSGNINEQQNRQQVRSYNSTQNIKNSHYAKEGLSSKVTTDYSYRGIPSITDQLSCHTFTIETAYSL